ncbi:hypothetical protein [Calothrix sp. CCY 0018]|uniref:hypothetical protein n=1 Tax=Calothrix sp. CCY 0018 TaxID=3103864 RepID=UPI0039C73AE6
MEEELAKKAYQFPLSNPESSEDILELLRQSEWRNLRIVLIFTSCTILNNRIGIYSKANTQSLINQTG